MFRKWVWGILMVLYVSALWAQDKTVLQLGVFSYLGEAQTRAKYQPIVDYLNQNLKEERVVLHILPQDELERQIALGKMDLVTTNPTHFLVARQQNLVSGVVATLVEKYQDQPLFELGGLIITRADQTEIQSLEDVRNKTIAIPGYDNMGGYRAQAFELHQAGVRLPSSAKKILEVGTHQAVVKAVLQGEADIGFLRDGILEQMLAQDEIEPDVLRVINLQAFPDFPHQVSTRLYPQWPIFALAHVDERSLRHFTSVLFSLEPEDPQAKAAGIYGYSVPADYQGVEEMARALRLPPYDQMPDFTLADVFEKWSGYLVGLLISLLIITALALSLYWAMRRERQEHNRFEQLLSTLGEGVYGTDTQGLCTFINPAAVKLLGLKSEQDVLGKNQHALFHHHYPDGNSYPQSQCPIHKTAQDGEVRRLEEWFFTKDGRGFPVNLVVTPVFQNRKLVGSVVVFQDITEQKRMQQQLLELATKDSLTGLANRRSLLEAMEHEHALIKRNHQPAALFIVDFDYFKKVNDQFGHSAGDAVLKAFSKILRHTLRETDFAGRFGGEEFVVLLAETDIQAAQQVAERLRQNVETHRLAFGQNELRFTISIGLTLLTAKDSIEVAIARADQALYRAKANGRNRIEVRLT